MQLLKISLNTISSLKALICGLLCFLGFLGTSIGQTATSQKEQVYFHTPKTLYFSGEKIWFEAQVSLGERPTSSQVLYAELVDRNSNSITHVKVPLQSGVALNFIPVSDQIPSDQYLLRVYTRISPYLDLNQGVAQQLVTIINPKIPPKEVTSSNHQIPQSSKSYKKGAAVNFASSNTAQGQVEASGISIANPFLVEEQKQLPAAEVYENLVPQLLFFELFGHFV